jgi:hypothetical protein
MDEKEAIKDIRWEFSKGRSRAEVTRRLQKKGLKLEFIDSLIDRANRPKKILITTLLTLLVLSSLWIGFYAVFVYEKPEKVIYVPTYIEKEEGVETSNLKISPELISLLISEIGGTKLRPNPINLKKPIINFNVEGKEFYCVIGKNIETFEGTNNEADLHFFTDEKTLGEIFLMEDIKEGVRNSIIEGKTKIEKISSDQELFLKGYLGLYKDLE